MQPDASADTPALDAARTQTQAAASSLKSGAKAMSSASDNLKPADTPAATEQQEKAEGSLRRARDELEAAKKKLQQHPSTQSMAGKQQQVGDETGGLADQMRKDAAAEGSQGQPGQQG